MRAALAPGFQFGTHDTRTILQAFFLHTANDQLFNAGGNAAIGLAGDAVVRRRVGVWVVRGCQARAMADATDIGERIDAGVFAVPVY